MSAPLKLPFSAAGRTIWLRIFMLLLKYTNTAKHAVTQNSENSKHIPDAILQYFLSGLSQNHGTTEHLELEGTHISKQCIF